MNEDFVEIWILDIEAPQSERSFEAGFQHCRGRRPGFELQSPAVAAVRLHRAHARKDSQQGRGLRSLQSDPNGQQGTGLGYGALEEPAPTAKDD